MAHVASMIDLFNMDNIHLLQEMGYQVDVACNFEYGSVTSQQRVDEFKQELQAEGINVYHIPVPRKITAIRDILESCRRVKKLVKEYQYEIVHCQSPIGGVIARLACKGARKKGTKVIYVAHGFHFYKGASLKNWFLFYPIEKYCARYTDCLVTINQEDYRIAKKKMSKAKSVEYIPGVGSKTENIKSLTFDKQSKRHEFGIQPDTTILLIVGEFIKRKNHEAVIRAFATSNLKDTVLLLCGRGILENELKKLVADLNLSEKVIFTGYRKDIDEIVNIADVFLFPSFQEGLPISVIEAMAAGLPILCSDIRGNNDLITQGEGGYLFPPTDLFGIQQAMQKLVENVDLREAMGRKNQENVKQYDISNVRLHMKSIYESIDR